MNRDEPLLAVDIGGTKLRAGLMSPLSGGVSRVLRARTRPTSPDRGAAHVTDEVIALGSDLLDGRRPGLVGIGSAGVVGPGGTIVSATDAIPGWAGVPIAGRLSAAFDAPAHALNDVHAFLLGEAAAGAARGHADAIGVAAGTGIGGALLVGGSPHAGGRGVAGHLGHIPVTEAGDRRCPCGRAGHLEAVASGSAMEARYAERAGEALDLPAIATRARAGDAAAREIIATAGRALGGALGGLVNTFDPDVIVLGGGAAHGLGGLLLDPLRSALAATTLPALAVPPLRVAALGEDAVLVGAIVAAHRALPRKEHHADPR